MKDPNDKKTPDFGLLADMVEQAPSRAKPGPKPKGDKAMTPAQKQKAYRDRVRAEKEAKTAAAAAGKPPVSKIIDLTTDFASLLSEKQRP